MTIKRITFLQELLAFMGLEDRVHLEWISSAEAQKFVRVITDFTAKIRSLGPNPLAAINAANALWKPGAPPVETDALFASEQMPEPETAAATKEAAHEKASETVA